MGLKTAGHIYKNKQRTKMLMSDAQSMHAEKMARGDIEYKSKPVRQASQPPVHTLEPIQERVPLYSDLRRERIEQHKNKMTHVFEKAFN